MGRRSKSICAPVVELVRLHHVVLILMYHITTNCGLGALALPWYIWGKRNSQNQLANGWPHNHIRRSICCCKCLLFCSHNLLIPSQPSTGTPTDISWMHADRHWQIPLHLLPCVDIVCLRVKPVVLLLWWTWLDTRRKQWQWDRDNDGEWIQKRFWSVSKCSIQSCT